MSVRLKDFQVMVGPNGSGKSTLLDVLGFLQDLMQEGLDHAISKRTNNFLDLTYQKKGERIYLAVEAALPEAILAQQENKNYTNIGYCLTIGEHNGAGVAILDEKVFLFSKDHPDRILGSVQDSDSSVGIALGNPKNSRLILHTNSLEIGEAQRRVTFISEKGAYGEVMKIRGAIRTNTSGFASLLPFEDSFPASNWFKNLLIERGQLYELDSWAIRKASKHGFKDFHNVHGEHLPWLLERFIQEEFDQYEKWVAHIRKALPDIVSVVTVERPEDRHRYIMVKYEGGLTLPSWAVSEGTMRILALTLIGFVKHEEGCILMVEEPENGIHPQAVEVVVQALKYTFGTQVIISSHSPVVLSMLNPEDLLCFQRTSEKGVRIIPGELHPSLQDWQNRVSLGTIFASGILDLTTQA